MESNHQLSLSQKWPSTDDVTRSDTPRALERLCEKETSDPLSTGRFQVFSLRTKLLLFASALVLIPGGIYGAITLSSSRTSLAQVIGHQLIQEARNGADRLATTLRSERERLASFAAQDVMREIRIADLDKRICSFLASVKRGSPACVDLLVLDRTGQVVASSNPFWIGKSESTLPGGPDSGEVIEGPFSAASVDGS